MANEYLDRLRTVGVLKRGLTKPIIEEGRDASGARTKAVTDELGHTVTEHNTRDDRVDVTVRPQMVQMEGRRADGDHQ